MSEARLLDTYRAVETAEGVELGLRVAGPPVRMLAWGLDALLRTGGYLALAIAFGLLGEVGQGLLLVTIFLGEWFYPVWFEVRRGGATPGKKRLGLVVLHDDGTPVGWSASVVRNLVRFADFLPLAYGFGLVAMLVAPDFKRLGDLAAGTVVVHRGKPAAEEGLPDGPSAPPAVPLSLAERRAVVEFARRLPTWTDDRARELADLAAPLTGATGRAGVERLAAAARWLVGKR
jgi:uncharacterized RDD family membrane protein YckC